jgi:stearoyl-CoA desaturase (delta-9 desaturase)
MAEDTPRDPLVAKISGNLIRTPKVQRQATIGLVLPALFCLLGAYLALTGRVTALDLGLCAGMYAATMLGITMGYHRLFTHRSYKAHPALRVILGAFGAMSAQGPISLWCSIHRRHHQWSDRDGDPHSPHADEQPTWRAFWHAHMGWIVAVDLVGWERQVPDLLQDPAVRFVDGNYPRFMLLGLLIPAVLGGVLGGGWQAALTGMLWGGPIRAFLCFNGTWLINSLCHVVGSRPYATHDKSANNAFCALLTMGEGWHNNHHAFPASARHGLLWWQLDPSYYLIALASRLGLASQVVLPDASLMASKRRENGEKAA